MKVFIKRFAYVILLSFSILIGWESKAYYEKVKSRSLWYVKCANANWVPDKVTEAAERLEKLHPRFRGITPDDVAQARSKYLQQFEPGASNRYDILALRGLYDRSAFPRIRWLVPVPECKVDLDAWDGEVVKKKKMRILVIGYEVIDAKFFPPAFIVLEGRPRTGFEDIVMERPIKPATVHILLYDAIAKEFMDVLTR